jgi:hypothetical protein
MTPTTFMGKMVCSRVRQLSRLGASVAVVAALLLGLGAIGCGGGAKAEGDGLQTLSAPEAKTVLGELPYRYKYRTVLVPRGATAALAGRAYGPSNTSFDFGIALGDGTNAVPVAQAGVSEVVGNPGFVFTSNLVVPVGRAKWENSKQIHSARQLHVAADMVTEMEEQLCRAITGEPCPV